MGAEVRCDVEWAGRRSAGVALYEERDIVFRGDFRLKIALREVTAAAASAGCLTLETARGVARLHLGPQAEAWARKVANPRSLADKLGVKPASRVAFLDLDDEGLRREVEARAGAVASPRAKDLDLVFLGVREKGDLVLMEGARRAIRPAGAVWVVWTKGRPELREATCAPTGRAPGSWTSRW